MLKTTDDITLAVTSTVNRILNPTGYLLNQLIDLTAKNVAKSEENSDMQVPSLREEVERQELQMRIAEAQARVAQELAIATRIETAEEVEMEEFYEYCGEGNIGAKTDGETFSVGAGGSGKRVSKRVYRFRGNSSIALDETTSSDSDSATTDTQKKRGSR
ncbi:hypothetical protein Ga0123462_0844 [Mariprofundus ferrinatatus]|uniref:Uncharacterized protein n=1 Tax=Mariprofundus ferrinatatus TaxID=1921087 RepID=A0A2K8L380_9PROT|nr:hypothetical protein [Mariprofundus ferrinatatus]ATX81713.1 hypothetical protein Ga0123462_0844 [Mariprofundus ferrinatatus]